MAPLTDLADRLDRIVLYQIYPQSFADANGDGIGDLAGIRERLDYLAWLGVDALWLNPCFASPFFDAGYDISDFHTIAPRYGTNADLVALVEAAGERGIGIVLDLVAGHTSDQHPWFVAEATRVGPAGSAGEADRYIWSDVPRDGFVAGPHGGYYKPNFFDCQPALNFGYARTDPAEPWRQGTDSPAARANVQALRDVLASWFDLGVAGFRVDMAGAMVKDDPDQVATAALWTEMRAWLDAAYPGRLLIAEWGDPSLAVPAGFHSDLYLHFGGGDEGLALRSLWNNGQGVHNPIWGRVPCWADAAGAGDAAPFVAAWRRAADAIADAGHGGVAALPTSTHDFARLACGDRTPDQLGAAFALVLTWPVLPSIYYGDEIGMRFLPDTPPIEGAALGDTHNRAGSRTPMQWGPLASDPYGPGAPADSRYLPPDPDPDRPTVAAQMEDSGSLLHRVRDLVALRRSDPRLAAGASVEVLSTTYPMAYVRGGTLLVATNPSGEAVSLTRSGAGAGRIVVGSAELHGDEVRLAPFGYVVIDLA